MTRGRNLVIALIATLLLLGASELLGHLAVANDAAGALLSSGGAHPLAVLLASAYALTRLAGTAMVCVATALTAAYATRRVLDRRARPHTNQRGRPRR